MKRGCLRVGGLFIFLLLCGVSYFAYTKFTAPPSRPYDTRPGYAASKSMKPVQVDMYQYANKKWDPGSVWDNFTVDRFEIVDVPPLSFNFPDAYYWTDPSHKGGPQGHIGIHFDLDTLDPLPMAPFMVNNFSRPDWTSKAADEYRRRKVMFSLTAKRGVGRGPDLIKKRDRSGGIKDDVERKQYGAQFAGVINGYQIVDYKDRGLGPEHSSYKEPRYIADDLDIENVHFKAFPLDQDNHIASYVECFASASGCRAEFIYHGRQVKVNFSNQHFENVDGVAQKVITLLDKYRLPPAVKREY